MFQDDNPVFEFRGPWGVPIQIGASIMLLPLFYLSVGGSAEDLIYDLIFVAILMGSILLHELGHAWGCLIQGIRVRRIMLHGGGGFCERSVSATRYEQELIVAMGPIVNLVIWAVASLIEPHIVNDTLGWAVWWAAQVNLFLAIFNLLPVQPLDGGKLFQLALMRLFSPGTAVRISGFVGLGIAVAWIPLMAFAFFTLGFVLFFFPPLRLHWQMAVAAR